MNGLWPQKTIELSELSSYDQTLGINSRQRAMVKEASGETGLTNYRNYINVASHLQKPKSVVIISSPENHQLAEIVPIVDEYILPTVFFDFAEIMADETGYQISDVKFNNAGKPRITVVYTNPNGRTHRFGPGEDFMMDRFYLTWTPSNVELGHYYERLVCSNG